MCNDSSLLGIAIATSLPFSVPESHQVCHFADLHTLCGNTRAAPNLTFVVTENGFTESQEAQGAGQEAASPSPSNNTPTTQARAFPIEALVVVSACHHGSV